MALVDPTHAERQAVLSRFPVPPRSLGLVDPVFGLDVSTQRLALGIVGPGPRVLWHYTPLAPGPPGAVRLAGAHADALAWLGAKVTQHRPVYVVVEQPFARGHHVHPELHYAVGVVLAALGQVMHVGGIVDLMGPPAWKRRALGDGHGAATKAQVMAWAREACDYGGHVQDEADALAIATAGAIHWTRSHATLYDRR